ncbi:MAG: hypothetical protein M1569_00950 [Candidatus Marsarchaeota archaeon]|nr:hypothetical protein [Candidatus Marsarchaeota archaeon]MCL5412955.1 hypothetical protein [Candidatus Marsarchaeota archaeon]
MSSSPGLAKKILVIAAVVIAIAVIAFFALNGTPVLSSNATISLNKNTSYDFLVSGDSNLSSIFLASSSSSGATFYAGVSPVLSNPIKVITLSPGQMANISTESFTYSNLQITLISSNPSSARLMLTYIPKNLYIRQSSGVSLLGGPATVQTTKATATTTTLPAATTVNVKATTTISASSGTAVAVQVANQTGDGQLMVQWNTLYTKEASTCTESNYNSTFAKAYNQVPTGPMTFANSSRYVPHGISASAVQVAPDIYNVTYTALISAGNMKVLVLKLNVTGQFAITSAFSGLFKSYSDSLTLYQDANISGDPCSAYV